LYIYRFFTDGYVYIYAIELRKIGCLFSFSYVGVIIITPAWSGQKEILFQHSSFNSWKLNRLLNSILVKCVNYVYYFLFVCLIIKRNVHSDRTYHSIKYNILEQISVSVIIILSLSFYHNCSCEIKDCILSYLRILCSFINFLFSFISFFSCFICNFCSFRLFLRSCLIIKRNVHSDRTYHSIKYNILEQISVSVIIILSLSSGCNYDYSDWSECDSISNTVSRVLTK
jgi:hypothetical protein